MIKLSFLVKTSQTFEMWGFMDFLWFLSHLLETECLWTFWREEQLTGKVMDISVFWHFTNETVDVCWQAAD